MDIKRISCIFAVSLTVLSACQQTLPVKPDPPVREKDIPEKVEAEMLEILEKDWMSLLDTVKYFNANLLSQGVTKGTGPDGVYYELAMEWHEDGTVSMAFFVQDSLFATASGSLIPARLKVKALETVLEVAVEDCASLHLSVGNIGVKASPDFLIRKHSSAELQYENAVVGYITREYFENEDYIPGMYFLIHYYNDPRTFAFYDNIFH